MLHFLHTEMIRLEKNVISYSATVLQIVVVLAFARFGLDWCGLTLLTLCPV